MCHWLPSLDHYYLCSVQPVFQQIAGDQKGHPDFSSVKAKDLESFLAHPFLMLPLPTLYRVVFDQCSKILSREDSETVED